MLELVHKIYMLVRRSTHSYLDQFSTGVIVGDMVSSETPATMAPWGSTLCITTNPQRTIYLVQMKKYRGEVRNRED